MLGDAVKKTANKVRVDARRQESLKKEADALRSDLTGTTLGKGQIP
ncbi:MAG: hypothetical protein QMC36_08325 [Patescibacteria group bacterium]